MSKAYKELSPCKGCDKRVVGCHAECKEYQAWTKTGVQIVTQPLPWNEMRIRSKRR